MVAVGKRNPQGPPATYPAAKASRKSNMYNTGVLVENPTMGNAFFRKRMGYVNPDRASTATVATSQYGFQANWRGKTHFTTPLISGVHSGVAPGQEIETSLYQVRAMNPPWPPVATHRTDMLNPSWQANVNAYGGHSGTIEMLAGDYARPLPMANDLLEEISAQAIDEHKRKAAFDPLSATYAMEHRGIAEVLTTDRVAALSKYRENIHKDPRDPTYRIMEHTVDDTTRSRDSGRRFSYEQLKRWKDMNYPEYVRPPTAHQIISRNPTVEARMNEMLTDVASRVLKDARDRQTVEERMEEMLTEVGGAGSGRAPGSGSSSSSKEIPHTPTNLADRLQDDDLDYSTPMKTPNISSLQQSAAGLTNSTSESKAEDEEWTQRQQIEQELSEAHRQVLYYTNRKNNALKKYNKENSKPGGPKTVEALAKMEYELQAETDSLDYWRTRYNSIQNELHNTK